MTTREIIVEMVRANPNVTRKAISERTGVTKERVRQILNSEALSVPYGRPYKGPWCRTCNKRMPGALSNICEPCRIAEHPPIQFICELEQCGKTFTLPQWEVKSLRRRHLPERRFCSKQCWGSFAGNNYGFVAHPSNRQHHALKTHCKHGHPFDEENTYRSSSNPTQRYCRACQKRRSAAYHRKKAQS